MSKNKLTVFFVLLLFVGSLVFGCGSPDDNGNDQLLEENNGSEIEKPEESETPEIDKGEGPEPGKNVKDWISLDNIMDLVEIVEEMQWNLDGNIFHYAYLGSDAVDNEQSEVVSITVDNETSTFWLDSSGSILQGSINDEYVPAEMIDYMEMYLLAPLLPFQLSLDSDLQLALAGDSAAGWNVIEHEKTAENIDRGVKVNSIDPVKLDLKILYL